jgi:hypothetical protein
LRFGKLISFNDFAGIYEDLVALDAYCEEVERPWSRRVKHISRHIECGCVTRADELLDGLIPGYAAAKVRAFPIQGKETAIGEANQEKPPQVEGRYRSWRKIVDSTTVKHATKFAFGYAWK